MEHNDDGKKEEKQKKHEWLAVAVITPSGTYPSDDDYARVHADQTVDHFLKKAASHLHLLNTSDWIAYVDNNQAIDIYKTFAANGLSGVVEIEWHKAEGGGGA